MLTLHSHQSHANIHEATSKLHLHRSHANIHEATSKLHLHRSHANIHLCFEVTSTLHISTEVVPTSIFAMKLRQHFIRTEAVPTFMKPCQYSICTEAVPTFMKPCQNFIYTEVIPTFIFIMKSRQHFILALKSCRHPSLP